MPKIQRYSEEEDDRDNCLCIDYGKGCLRIISMDDVGFNVKDNQSLDGRAGEKSKTLSVILPARFCCRVIINAGS
jgi:hypothetical protein